MAAAVAGFTRAFAAMLPGEVAAEGVFSGGEIAFKFFRDRNEHKEIYADNKAAFIESLKSMYYGEMTRWVLDGTKDGPNLYFDYDFTHFDPVDVSEEYGLPTQWGHHYYEISLYSDGTGNLLNRIAYEELVDREKYEFCKPGTQQSKFDVYRYKNPDVDLDYERFKETEGPRKGKFKHEPGIVACCPESLQFNGISCQPKDWPLVETTPEEKGSFICKVIHGKDYTLDQIINDDPVAWDTNYTCKKIEVPAFLEGYVNQTDCLKKGFLYEYVDGVCRLKSENNNDTTNNGVSNAIDYMTTINEGSDEDEETPPPDTTPPPTDTGMSDADRERLNNYRRRRF